MHHRRHVDPDLERALGAVIAAALVIALALLAIVAIYRDYREAAAHVSAAHISAHSPPQPQEP